MDPAGCHEDGVSAQLHISSATLVERSSQLATILKEVELRRSSHDVLNENIQSEKVCISG